MITRWHLLLRLCQRVCHLITNECIFFNCEWLIASYPTPELEDDPCLLAVHECLFTMFTATLHDL